MSERVLKFEFEETPKWRELEIRTSEMIAQITHWRNVYNKLPQGDAKDLCTKHFAQAMTIGYIHNLNVGEMVGTQNYEETEKLLRKCFANDSTETSQFNGDRERSEMETINTFKAMKLLGDKSKEMDMTGMLTVQEICDVHGVLLKGLHEDAGKIRKKDVYTHWNDAPHFYPSPNQVACLFYSLVDHHNINIENIPSDSDSTTYIFKCAAHLLFDFVNTHPFSDGNGRMCRLLANYVVGLITPFPVSVYHTQNPARSGRDDYIRAIVRCREHPDEGPHELATMLVEGAWRGWDSLFKNLERRELLHPGRIIGPIIVKQSACNEQYVSERVDHIWCYAGEGKQETKEKVIELILGATRETDVSKLHSTQYTQRTIPVDESSSTSVKLDNN